MFTTSITILFKIIRTLASVQLFYRAAAWKKLGVILINQKNQVSTLKKIWVDATLKKSQVIPYILCRWNGWIPLFLEQKWWYLKYRFHFDQIKDGWSTAITAIHELNYRWNKYKLNCPTGPNQPKYEILFQNKTSFFVTYTNRLRRCAQFLQNCHWTKFMSKRTFV